MLRDGTIWFNIDGVSYHLGITNGKPDWVNSAGADFVETWYKKTETSTNVTFSSAGSFSVKDNVYYIDGTMHSTVSGTYYRRVSHFGCLYYISSKLFLAYNHAIGVEVYIKATFSNGVKTINGIVESITTPLKWAMKNQYIENITFYGLKRRNTKSEERAILTMEEADKVMNIGW